MTDRPNLALPTAGREQRAPAGHVRSTACSLRPVAFEDPMLQTLQLAVYGSAPMPPSLLNRLIDTDPGLGFHQRRTERTWAQWCP